MRPFLSLAALFTLLALSLFAARAEAADPAHGREVFQKCAACHSLTPGQVLVGPSLAGILGRKAGSLPGFDYSPAMRGAGFTWTPEKLDAYLADPEKVVPGNQMPFPGLPSAEDRADLIAYLAAGGEAAAASPSAPAATAPVMVPEVHYVLRTGVANGRMVFIGVGGRIDGVVDPELEAAAGQTVQVTLINGEGMQHDIVFDLPDGTVRSARVNGAGASSSLSFVAPAPGQYAYFCSVPGHREAGMSGTLRVVREMPKAPPLAADLSHDPAGVPPAVGGRGPQTVSVLLEAVEAEGRLADGVSFPFWTFNRTVPGPFIRVREGDEVVIRLRNAADSTMMHSIDFHAALAPGGGAMGLQVKPGEEKAIRFKATSPGLFVYHCGTPMVAEHIANGMFGLILVEPAGGLPPVDHEFYVMQSEIYTAAPFGKLGAQEFSVSKLLDERPEYIVFNGAVGALTALHPLRARTGERIRIFFGDAGPNLTSSFHVIGEIMDRAYPDGTLRDAPRQGVQTLTVGPGSAAIVEFTPHVPGRFVLVDHALARVQRGLVGFLDVTGPADLELYRPEPVSVGAP
jgi:nitrite reductase (NO-forming)